MSTLVEARYGEKTSAKDILARFVDAFGQKISNTRDYEELFSLLERYIADGEILFASRDDSIDTFLSHYRKTLPWIMDNEKLIIDNSKEKSLNLDPPQLRNWAYPVLTSLSGNKSDRDVERLYTSETLSS